jgi:hypothetical protein
MEKSRLYFRPDYYGGSDCPGKRDCDGRSRCLVFGLIGMCEWPCSIPMDNFTTLLWDISAEAGLAERWLGTKAGPV